MCVIKLLLERKYLSTEVEKFVVPKMYYFLEGKELLDYLETNQKRRQRKASELF